MTTTATTQQQYKEAATLTVTNEQPFFAAHDLKLR
jgi:hypothetical protein